MKLNPGTICLHLKHFLLCINCRCICGNSIIIIIIIILISQHQPGLSDQQPHQQPHQMIIIIFISNMTPTWSTAEAKRSLCGCDVDRRGEECQVSQGGDQWSWWWSWWWCGGDGGWQRLSQVVLSACSPYFQQLFSENSCQVIR